MFECSISGQLSGVYTVCLLRSAGHLMAIRRPSTMVLLSENRAVEFLWNSVENNDDLDSKNDDLDAHDLLFTYV